MSSIESIIDRGRRRRRLSRAAVATASCALAAGALVGPAAAATSTPAPDASGNFTFKTLNNHRDPTFNQLLGINQAQVIVGYFGSGLKGHPNKGYVLYYPYGQRNYVNENFPHSAQTQVTGLNNNGVTVGFWANAKGANFGFYKIGNRYHSVNFPTHNNAKPPLNQLLGVNDSRVAVGFYNDAKGNAHGYTYNIRYHTFRRVNVPGASSVTASAINQWGDVAGFDTNAAGNTVAFLQHAGGRLITLAYPGATATQALGVNDGDEVVGFYMLGSGNSATTHGFIWAPGFGFANVDDPNGVGATTINGVNDRGQLVGFYTDSAGNTDGLLASPK